MKKKVLSKKIISSKIAPRYSAVFELDEQGCYNVSFPAFPGCVTFGKTFEEAKKMAEEALGLWIEEMESRKEKIPNYSTSIITEIHPRVFA